MKTNLDWLREFVPIDVTADALADELTMAGLEVDSVLPAAGGFEGVIVAEIVDKRSHPEADRLSICSVDDGTHRHEIVCGAPNAAAGLKVPLAKIGTVLPGGLRIEAARIRGVRSDGMLCSARELGLSDDAGGLLVLDADATPGRDVREHLRLDDEILDIDLTPNRGDCFSVIGVAREIAARRGLAPLDEAQDCVDPSTDRTFGVELIDTPACPRFAGRVVSGLDIAARSPDWLRERLRRAGLRAIHPVVDVTNYVMLETGQPLHAYRLDKLAAPISVRFARPGESLTLLDETRIELDKDTLVIADASGAIGLAGIMGGLATAVDAATEEIFLESAYFSPAALQGRARRYGLHTDASVRFERGVDPTGQERAIERATDLLESIAGGRAGPITVAEDAAAVPARAPVLLRASSASSRLGLDVPPDEVERLMQALGMEIEPVAEGWRVTPPSYRFDIAIEEDLIEEIGRMIGYDRIPVVPGTSAVHLGGAPETEIAPDSLADTLVARGFTEIVSYGFTEAGAQSRITGADTAVNLANPISRDMNVLRDSLWPGLLRTARLNASHQLARCRVFEIGTVFETGGDAVRESLRLGALVTGSREPVGWDGDQPPADIYDLKGDVEALLSIWRDEGAFEFKSEANAALNPSRSSAVYRRDARVGWLGELHPSLQDEYELKAPVVMFELDLSSMRRAGLPKLQDYSKFPSVRRDLAIVVDEGVQVADLTKVAVEVLGDALTRYEIFDVYRGKGVDSGRKSIGIGLILQNAYRTLTDAETDDMIHQVVRRLERELGATIRN